MALCLLFVSIFLLDRFSKFLALKYLSLPKSFPVIKNIFHLTLVYNHGSAFGIFKKGNEIFIILSFLAILFIVYQLKNYSHMSLKFALVLILSGAIGNLIDRLAWGYVVDFLDFRIWPVFNFADVSITCGIILLFYNLIFNK